MGNRNLRVSELIKREISDILHTHMRAEAIMITITGVDVSPDHRNAEIYFSVLGDEIALNESEQFLRKKIKYLRGELSKRIVLKYLPKLHFTYDDSLERGNRLLRILDEIDEGAKD
jgi:ribosome-binding factor A